MYYRLIHVANFAKFSTTLFLLLFLFNIVLNNTVIADSSNTEVQLKSIIPLSFIPKYNISFENFELPGGTLYQSGSEPDFYRNQIIFLDETESLSTIQDMWISGFRETRLIDTHNNLFFQNFSYSHVTFPRRWSFFIIGADSGSAPPSPMFGDEHASWTNFGNGFYYVNESGRSIAIWTWYPSNYEYLTYEVLKIVNSTFYFYEWNYLELNYYLKEYINYCQTCLSTVSSVNDMELNNYLETTNKYLSESIRRKNQFNTEYANLTNSSHYFYFIPNAFGIIQPLQDEISGIISTTIEQNTRNLETLQETRSILQNEIYERRIISEIQRDYTSLIISFLAFAVVVIISIPNFIRFIKWLKKPVLDVKLVAYSEIHKNKRMDNAVTLEYIDSHRQYKMELTEHGEYILRRKNYPILGIIIRPKDFGLIKKWDFSYNMDIVEVITRKQFVAEYEEIFAKIGKRPWIEGSYTDMHGDLKVFTDLTLTKEKTSDPTVIGFKLNYKFKENESRKITIRISTKDSKKLFEKDFYLTTKKKK